MSYSHRAKGAQATRRIPAKLNSKLDRNLLAYAAAAGAVGVGVLTLAEPSRAEVVFTPTHQTISSGHGLWLDLNGDGITDFFFKDSGGHGVARATCAPSSCPRVYWGDLEVKGAKPENQLIGVHQRGAFPWARALPTNAKVGSSAAFVSGTAIMGTFYQGTDGDNRWEGYWFDLKGQFLGLKFSINGETHYGWARLSVGQGAQLQFHGILTGYAYETLADTPILTGQRSGPDVGMAPTVPAATLEPASLGRLAQGAYSLAAWR